MVCGADWPSILLTMAEAYLEESGRDPQRNGVPAARMALLHALFSLYGVEEHLRGSSNFGTDDVISYWERRFAMTRMLLPSVTEIEDALRDLALRAWT